MVSLYNSTETIGMIISGGTQTTTGSLFITLLIIILVLLAMALMLGIRLEYTAVLVFPLLLSFMAFYSSEWMVIGGTALIYLGIIAAKNFVFR